MKILAIKIDGFGKWVDVNLPLDSHLQAIYGPNEAGKSTLVTFILSVLFGFANGRGKNKYERYIPRETEAYGGSLLVEHQGQRYWINRSKGSRGGNVQITDENGQASKMTLHELLGPLNLDLVRNVFYFDQGELSTVSDVTDDQLKQNLQQVGAVGSMRWQEKKEELDSQAKRLYGVRANTRPLNVALKEVDRLDSQLATAQENNQQYVQFQKDLSTKQKQLQQLSTDLQSAQKDQEEAVRLQRLWPVYQQFKDASDNKKQQHQASDDQIVKLQQIRAQEPELKRSVIQKRQKIGQIGSKLQQINQNQIQSYAARWRENNDPRPLLKKIQADVLAHQRQASKVQDQQNELAKLEQKYGKPLPDPLNDSEVQQVQQLMNQQNSQHTFQGLLTPGSLVLGLGILLMIVGLALPNVTLTLIACLVLVAGGYLLYLQSRKKRSSDNNQEAIAQFGRDHDLDRYPVDNWLAMQGDLHHGQDLEQAISSYDKEGQHLQDLQKQWSQRFPDFNTAASNDFWQQLLNNLDQLERSYQRWEQLQDELKTAEEDMAHSRDQLLHDEQVKKAGYQQLKVTDDKDFERYLKDRTASIKSDAQVEATSQQLKPADRQALEALGTAKKIDQNVLDRQKAVSQLMARQNQLTADQESLKVQLHHLVKDGTVTELEQQLANAQAKVNQLLKQYLSLRLTEEWISRSLEKASADRYPLILQRAVEYFKLLTDGHYQNIDFDDKGNLMVTSADRLQFNINELSTGTAEQLYVALRLGFIKVMSDTIEFPLIIDDGFVNFDRIRKQKMIELLQSMAETGQVIYLTADDRICDKQNDISVLNLAQSSEENLK
ncbi:AAA family ATPase [Limosilactobacillus sp.]|uniref:ATP-binding protein n=1 Tax=Limosilactobacillus sp. TaxID=2773925 RepID=UPI00345E5428